MQMTNAIIQTRDLTYGYSKDAKILFDININIERGSVYGFLGPNGSGKTTTLSLLLGLLQGAHGEIEIFGLNIKRHRVDILKRIGSLIETPSLYGHLTARENLEVYRRIYGADKQRMDEVLHTVGLQDSGRKITRRFSLGMKQRLAVALALLPSPELLILDEPTNGLDPTGIIELRELIQKLNKQHGITILVSSHILSEVEKMVSHVGIISRGRMLFQGTLGELQRWQQKTSRLVIRTSDNQRACKLLEHYQPECNHETFSVTFKDVQEIAAITRQLVSSDLDVYMLNPVKHDLEQLYMDLTNSNI